MSRNAGFSIIVALFILVVLALLGAAIVTIGGIAHRQPLLSLEAKRAYWAAQSGLQWGAHEALDDPSFSCPVNPANPSSTTLAPSQPGLDGFTVTVTCSATTHRERGNQFTVYVITATAGNGTYGLRTDFVQRRYRLIVTDAP